MTDEWSFEWNKIYSCHPEKCKFECRLVLVDCFEVVSYRLQLQLLQHYWRNIFLFAYTYVNTIYLDIEKIFVRYILESNRLVSMDKLTVRLLSGAERTCK